MLSTWKQEIRRWRYAALIAVGRFRSPEPEYDRMGDYVKPGHLVVDVGANVGHYTRLFSRLVGDEATVHDGDGGPLAQFRRWADILFLGHIVADGALQGKGQVRLNAIGRHPRTAQTHLLLRTER